MIIDIILSLIIVMLLVGLCVSFIFILVAFVDQIHFDPFSKWVDMMFEFGEWLGDKYNDIKQKGGSRKS